eukprot:519650-Pelagomonas_calceolata.AAC.1
MQLPGMTGADGVPLGVERAKSQVRTSNAIQNQTLQVYMRAHICTTRVTKSVLRIRSLASLACICAGAAHMHELG